MRAGWGLSPGSLVMFRGCSSIVAFGMANFLAGGRPLPEQVFQWRLVVDAWHF